MNDFVKVFNSGKLEVNLLHLGEHAEELRPVEFHFKENGSVSDEPSVVIVMAKPHFRQFVFGQMSLVTLNDCLNQVGYEIKKIKK